jgi:hypothetical protein
MMIIEVERSISHPIYTYLGLSVAAPIERRQSTWRLAEVDKLAAVIFES